MSSQKLSPSAALGTPQRWLLIGRLSNVLLVWNVLDVCPASISASQPSSMQERDIFLTGARLSDFLAMQERAGSAHRENMGDRQYSKER